MRTPCTLCEDWECDYCRRCKCQDSQNMNDWIDIAKEKPNIGTVIINEEGCVVTYLYEDKFLEYVWSNVRTIKFWIIPPKKLEQ